MMNTASAMALMGQLRPERGDEVVMVGNEVGGGAARTE
tara:strand:+ start:248 stop:361 length:114 start_codon:yes stop_codon:yes gene_type:complete